MKKLFIVVALSIILIHLNQGYSYPILEETPEEIIMQNSWIAVKISKATGEITTLYYMSSPVAVNLLVHPAYITIRDKEDPNNPVVYLQSEGTVAKIDTASNPPDSVRAVFDINFGPPLPTEYPYSIRIIYTLGVQAFHWDAELHLGISDVPDREANIDFIFPAIADMDYAFWTKDDAPFKLPMPRTIGYREAVWRVRSPLVIPALVLYDTTSNVGLSFISPFEINKPGLQFQLDTIHQEYVNSKLTVTNYYLRLGNNHPAHTALYIVPHEADWRPGFAWLYDKYPNYFNPKTALKGAGWHTFVDERTNDSVLADLKERGVSWVEYFHFPFYGYYAPCAPYAPNKDSWMIITDTLQTIPYDTWRINFYDSIIRRTGYDSNNVRITRWKNSLDIQTYLYFQSFESWKQFANEFFRDYIAIGANSETLPAWEYCYLMNPDPDFLWGKHIDSQIKVMLDKYPNIAGIFYDRDDYCDYDYNPRHDDDGVTMIGSRLAYMLGFAQERINYSVLKAVHEAGKGVWTNGPTSVEVCKDIDGIMSENLAQAPFYQYLGINRPLILEPYDIIPQKTEEKLKTALWTGHFPSVAYWDCDSMCLGIDSRYRPLFSLYKGKKWVFYPHALQLPEGIKGNIFRTPIPEEVAFPDTDYLVAMIDPERYTCIQYPDSARDIFRYDIQAKVRVPDSLEIKYCYIQSGDYKGINQDSIYRDNGLAINIPAHRVSSLIQLSKEPRYEITRTSSPVLTRGDSEEFEVRVQNIGNDTLVYKIQLITPFDTSDTDSFSLAPDSIREVGLIFLVPNNQSLEEDTMKVAYQSIGPNGAVIDTIVFTSWVVDILTFQLSERPFIHSGKCGDTLTGDTFPFILVNNTKRTLNVTLKGSLMHGSGSIRFGTPPYQLTKEVVLGSLEDMELLLYVAPQMEVDTVKIQAIVSAEKDTVYAIRPIVRALKQDGSDLFHDDFSTRNMQKWDDSIGGWDAHDSVAKGNGPMHMALKYDTYEPEPWTDYKYQVNTKLEGSINPIIDWLKSYIFFRVQDTSNFYRFGIHGSADGYDILNLYKRKSNIWTFLAKYEFKPKKNAWYNLSVEIGSADENNIKCFLDGKLVISATDTDTILTSGGIGIGVLEDGMSNYYDDIVVRELQR